MSNMKCKILVVGAAKVGKSAVSNALTGTHDKPSSNYRATQGVRILELDKIMEETAERVRSVALSVEMWDCSGDRRFESCWPAFSSDVNGTVVVFNPKVKEYEKELDIWYTRFVYQAGLKDEHCLFVAHTPSRNKGERKKEASVKIPSHLQEIALVKSAGVEESLDDIQRAFDDLLERVLERKLAAQEEEESAVFM